MRVLLLAKPGPYADKISDFLVLNGHIVDETFEKPTPEEMAEYDVGVSWYYRYILSKAHLDKLWIANCHAGRLPWGRGAMPNVFALSENLGAGVTVHWMNERVDDGDIIGVRDVEKLPDDDAYSLYHRLQSNLYDLFLQCWTLIEESVEKKLRVGLIQTGEHRTYRMKDAPWDLEKRFGKELAHEFVNVLRAGTYPGFRNCFIRDGDKKVYVSVNLEVE